MNHQPISGDGSQERARKNWIWRASGVTLLGAAAITLVPMLSSRVTQAEPIAAQAKTVAAQTYASAPELTGTQWLNTPGNKPITLASRRGKVTIVEFWTFGCSNCQANFPAYQRWDKSFGPRGVEVIGVHTPESPYEADTKNVKRRVKDFKIKYPVLLDPQGENWNRWKQKYWPTVYVLDKANRVRFKWEGELGSSAGDVPSNSGEAKINGIVAQLLKEDVQAAMPKAAVTKIVKTDAQWRALLTPVQFDILRRAGTEAPFSGDYQSHGAGVYRCAACDLELFQSDTKFDSGTGWPSFFRAIPGHVEEKTDNSFGSTRTEVLCARCGGHLGHVFDDGPAPTGLRYCMNSPALKFIPQGAKKL